MDRFIKTNSCHTSYRHTLYGSDVLQVRVLILSDREVEGNDSAMWGWVARRSSVWDTQFDPEMSNIVGCVGAPHCDKRGTFQFWLWE